MVNNLSATELSPRAEASISEDSVGWMSKILSPCATSGALCRESWRIITWNHMFTRIISNGNGFRSTAVTH